MSEVFPVPPSVLGFKQRSGTGAEQNVVRIGRIVGQGASIATIGPHGVPLSQRRYRQNQQRRNAEQERKTLQHESPHSQHKNPAGG